MKDHQIIDQRSLALARLIAEKIAANPALIARAESNVSRWLQTCSPGARPALLEWQRLLNGPLEGLIEVLRDSGEHATRLRQSNPFAGILSLEERMAIFQEFERRESDAA